MDQFFKLPDSPKERLDFWIALSVCFIGLGLVGWYSIYNGEASTTQTAEVIEAVSTSIDDVASVDLQTEVLEDETASDEADSEETAKSINLKEFSATAAPTVISTSFKDELSSVSEPISEKIEEPIVHEFEPKIEAVPEIKSADVKEEVLETITKAATVEKANPKAVQEVKSKIIQPAQVSVDCKILVGAFGDSKNLNLIIERLKEEGYDTFTTPFRGLTRVGIYNDCDRSSLENTLSLIRKEYADDAMILK